MGWVIEAPEQTIGACAGKPYGNVCGVVGEGVLAYVVALRPFAVVFVSSMLPSISCGALLLHVACKKNELFGSL